MKTSHKTHPVEVLILKPREKGSFFSLWLNIEGSGFRGLGFMGVGGIFIRVGH